MFNIKAIFENIILYSYLIPLILFFVFLSRNKKLELRVIFLYCLYSFINDYLITRFSSKGVDGDNSVFILLSLFTFVEYVLFSITFFILFRKRILKKLIFLASPVFLSVCAYHFYLDLYKSNIDSISITIEYLFIIAYCLIYFFEELNEPNTTIIYTSYKFWIVLGILIYSTGTFFFFMQSSELTEAQWEKWSLIN